MTFEEWKLAKTWHECLERQIVDETAAHLVEWMEAYVNEKIEGHDVFSDERFRYRRGAVLSGDQLLAAVKEYVNGKS